ncbi:arsenic (+3 oxidation state) methyltransferase [Monoraphidium neglectum]|uniref:Arsenite methyltransferase n=1 Tax=Monoraphidium neglectum TaxID=145388 RepID=A0A0D2LY61_9CHLO|nr:arsenic (+3 oxidation state) methyltransferase [Monoraphidium neglectum]KIY94416.1 arsenic (+3 oxidation state) methyltransferase [Monoraphidium neglectum]|eukprot:XP_013893436.1 arsenic (+3 oxidation state) methyltransferase [Monoraphidium neglectum]
MVVAAPSPRALRGSASLTWWVGGRAPQRRQRRRRERRGRTLGSDKVFANTNAAAQGAARRGAPPPALPRGRAARSGAAPPPTGAAAGGCGTGRDCYVCSALVGEKGFVTGIDMTDAQLDVARRHADAWARELGYAEPNTRFVKGRIEYLDEAELPDGSVDVVISNCVINLSPEKARCLEEVYRVLAPGGEMFFSDVYCDRRLPEAAQKHYVAVGECLGGALYVNDFITLCRKVGFHDPRVLSVEPIDVHDAKLLEVLGGAKFFSITFRWG